jgi:hypothetical protein
VCGREDGEMEIDKIILFSLIGLVRMGRGNSPLKARSIYGNVEDTGLPSENSNRSQISRMAYDRGE